MTDAEKRLIQRQLVEGLDAATQALPEYIGLAKYEHGGQGVRAMAEAVESLIASYDALHHLPTEED